MAATLRIYLADMENIMDKNNTSGTLYLVATPIGNLEDMTYRAVRILSEVNLIAAEDTRNSIKLLNHFDIKTPMTSYHEHNKYEKHLKNHLKRYIESGAADRMVILPVNFGSFRELVEYIGNAHERYLLKERNIAEDVQYILRICSQVIHGILQLAAKQFGREDILIPAAC